MLQSNVSKTDLVSRFLGGRVELRHPEEDTCDLGV